MGNGIDVEKGTTRPVMSDYWITKANQYNFSLSYLLTSDSTHRHTYLQLANFRYTNYILLVDFTGVTQDVWHPITRTVNSSIFLFLNAFILLHYFTPFLGILFYGPRGCGKTKLVAEIAARRNFTFISANASHILSPYVGDSEKKVAELFHTARLAQPSILFLDEIGK